MSDPDINHLNTWIPRISPEQKCLPDQNLLFLPDVCLPGMWEDPSEPPQFPALRKIIHNGTPRHQDSSQTSSIANTVKVTGAPIVRLQPGIKYIQWMSFMPYWLNQFHHWSVNLSRAMSPSDNLLEPFVLRSCCLHQGMEWRWSSLWNTSTIIDPVFDQESGSCGILWSEWSVWSLFCGDHNLTGHVMLSTALGIKLGQRRRCCKKVIKCSPPAKNNRQANPPLLDKYSEQNSLKGRPSTSE